MRELPTLRRELLAALALVFAGAFLVAAAGIIVLLPALDTPARAAGYVAVLLVVYVAVFAAFGRHLLRQRVLAPLERVLQGVEAIAAGDYDRRLSGGDTAEMARLAEAVNRMAERLIAHREQLAANIRSLQETNRQLTEARDELVQAEKMASVGRLGTGIAHEVGNPLSAVMGYLAVLRRSVRDPRVEEFITAAETEAQRIDRIVSGLLDYARPRHARPVPIDVNGVIEQTLELLETQGQFDAVAVHRDLASALPRVKADPHQLQQVLVNLLLNARDALHATEAPEVRIWTGRETVPQRPEAPVRRRDDPPDVDYSHRRRFHRRPRLPREQPVAPGGQVVTIALADNGPGIAEGLLDQIFEPFVTTKEPGQGTGLGLAVAARLVDGMGGTIRVESTLGQGATFIVMLPATREQASE